jgi:hypothetical protein
MQDEMRIPERTVRFYNPICDGDSYQFTVTGWPDRFQEYESACIRALLKLGVHRPIKTITFQAKSNYRYGNPGMIELLVFVTVLSDEEFSDMKNLQEMDRQGWEMLRVAHGYT